MRKTDILIVGSGCAGLYCALHLPKEKDITIITKSQIEQCNSFLAQGGICVLKDEEDFEAFFEDTLKAGHYENDKGSVEIMIRSSQDVLKDLLAYGVDFQKNKEGELVFTKEGAHSANRILYHEDTTGKEITSTLLAAVKHQKNISLLEQTMLIDIVEENNYCYGAMLQMADGNVEVMQADAVVIATGGIGGLYEHSTNYGHITGDAHAIAIKHGVELKNMDYVQIHPTTLYSKEGRSFLISESVRGEGAVLRDKEGKRFVNELLPRDLLTKEIWKQMEKDGTDYVWEDLRTIPEQELKAHFPNIIEQCKKVGYDVFNECIPVVPAQHYFMGGIKVDYHGKTSMEQLYAVGEAACNGVHGKNRLASNSLLESLVFAKRAALNIAEQFKLADEDNKTVEMDKEFQMNRERIISQVDLTPYKNLEQLKVEYQRLVKTSIETFRADENV
ncbi:MAG: L-aspartate oxidase [Agathobacter sp.]|nr:L-aspartate oxidase [Agathobacter sp.]